MIQDRVSKIEHSWHTKANFKFTRKKIKNKNKRY
jgi:hypothetical protein